MAVLPIKTETVSYEIPLTSYERLEIDLSQILARAQEEGVRPQDLKMRTLACCLFVDWRRPHLAAAS